MGRHRRRYSQRDNLIQLRRDNDPAKLARDWECEVVPVLLQSAQYYSAVLASSRSVAIAMQVWRLQRDDLDLLVCGTGDDDLRAKRKAALDEAEASMAALVRRIEAHNAEVRRRAN